MSLVRFLILLGIGTVFSWIAWILVLTRLDPQTGGGLTLALFYSTFFLAGVGTLTVIGFFLRYWLEKEKIPFQQVRVALRQSFLTTLGLSLALMLQAQRLLNPWSISILMLLIIVTEIFFLAGQSRQPHRQE